MKPFQIELNVARDSKMLLMKSCQGELAVANGDSCREPAGGREWRNFAYHCTVPHPAALGCTVLHFTVLHCAVLNFIVFHCIACNIVLSCTVNNSDLDHSPSQHA